MLHNSDKITTSAHEGLGHPADNVEKKRRGEQTKPLDTSLVIAKMRENYSGGEVIFYRFDPGFCEEIGASRQTLYKILKVGRANGAVPPPHKEGNKVYYSAEELIRVFGYFDQWRAQKKELVNKTGRLLTKKGDHNLYLALKGVFKATRLKIEDDRMEAAAQKISDCGIETTRLESRVRGDARGVRWVLSKEDEGKLIEIIGNEPFFDEFRQGRVSISRVVRESGISLPSRQIIRIAQRLEALGFNVKHKGTNFRVFKRDERKIAEILGESPDFNEFQSKGVRLLSGDKVNRPTSREFVDHRGYLSIRPILKQFDIKVGGWSGTKIEDLFGDDCKVSIFKYRAGYGFPVGQLPKLEQYIKEKLLSVN